MPFKLRIISDEDPGGASAYERVFYLPDVHLGSSGGNELVLKDTQRVISRQHARIFRDGHDYRVEDTRSRNGTLLNDRALMTAQPTPLKEGDKIRVGPYTLVFHALAEESDQTPTLSSEAPTAVLVDAPRLAAEIAAELRRVYQEHETSAPEVRQEALVETIRRATSGSSFDDRSRREVLRLVRQTFPDRSYELVRLQRKAEQLDAMAAAQMMTGDGPRVAHQIVTELARHLLARNEVSRPEDFTLFSEALGKSLDVFLRTAFESLQGRREWKHEFDLEQSMQIRVSHPIKRATSPENLAEYLFDVRGADPVKLRIELLSESLEDLAYHQVAILAGYEESIKFGLQWILQELAPANFKGDSRSLFSGHKVSWDKYVERHRELTREDNKRVQARFLAGFKRGYEDKLAELKRSKSST